jgi:hypothetical protein
MLELQYASDIIVGTTHKGEWAWFVSEKDFWFLDQEKLSRAFERKGYPVATDPRSRRYREVRAAFSDTTVRVYQAYSPAIADKAVVAQRFVPPFSRERMTWIMPSFTWMMYRSGWAEKEGQERILAIDILRSGSNGTDNCIC